VPYTCAENAFVVLSLIVYLIGRALRYVISWVVDRRTSRPERRERLSLSREGLATATRIEPLLPVWMLARVVAVI
jgi:hypothetical protein